MDQTVNFQERAKDVIQANGGRMTAQRELLIDLLAEYETDIDAERLHQVASQRDPNLSLPTVYRILHTLEDARVIVSHYVSSDHERKVYRVNDHQNVFHFTCRKCGRVTTFRSDLVGQLEQDLGMQLGADVLSLCICAGGLCAACRQEGT